MSRSTLTRSRSRPRLRGERRLDQPLESREGGGLNTVAEQELLTAREPVHGRDEPSHELVHRLQRGAGATLPASRHARHRPRRGSLDGRPAIGARFGPRERAKGTPVRTHHRMRPLRNVRARQPTLRRTWRIFGQGAEPPGPPQKKQGSKDPRLNPASWRHENRYCRSGFRRST